MTRTPVQSSNIASVGYDPKKRILEIEFQNGRIYQYQDVEANVHDGILNAASAGKYFFQYIRGNYAEAEVTPIVSVTEQRTES